MYFYFPISSLATEATFSKCRRYLNSLKIEKMKRILPVLILLISLTSWKSEDKKPLEGSEMISMRIQPKKVACDGYEGHNTCFVVQKGASIGTDFWETLPVPIDGFNFEEGYMYDVTIKIQLREEHNEDQSRFQYTLINVLSKKKA
jgi:hypothetical protein